MPRQKLPLPRRLLAWTFLVLCAASLITCAVALRENNLRMVELRDAVLQADKDNGDTEAALRKLRDYVGRHMNTELASGPNAVHPPIQLKYTYDRLTQAQAGSAGGNTQIYSEAQAYCEQTGSQGFSGSNRLACVQDYVQKNGTTDTPEKDPIPKNLYQFDFASPRWSPDLAGWSLVAGVFFAICLVITFISNHFAKRRARRA